MLSHYLICFFYLVVLVSCAQSIKADEWQYVDPLHPSELYGISSEPSLFGIDDLYYEAEICTDEDKYICIKAKGFEFYVPRNLIGNKSSWVVNDIKYEANMHEYYSLLGTTGNVYFVDQLTKKHSIRFIYSKSRGLIAMGGSSSDKSRLFLLTTKCGFGANSTCRDSITLKAKN